MSKKAFVFEPFDLPVFDVQQREHWPSAIPWERVMDEFDAMRRQYLKDFDSPEVRLRDKNPEPFRLD